MGVSLVGTTASGCQARGAAGLAPAGDGSHACRLPGGTRKGTHLQCPRQGLALVQHAVGPLAQELEVQHARRRAVEKDEAGIGAEQQLGDGTSRAAAALELEEVDVELPRVLLQVLQPAPAVAHLQGGRGGRERRAGAVRKRQSLHAFRAQAAPPQPASDAVRSEAHLAAAKPLAVSVGRVEKGHCTAAGRAAARHKRTAAVAAGQRAAARCNLAADHPVPHALGAQAEDGLQPLSEVLHDAAA